MGKLIIFKYLTRFKTNESANSDDESQVLGYE